MKAQFWHDKWSNNDIGFHQDTPNPLLMAHWSRLQITKNQTVFVPLCGKSLDLIWLKNQGHNVIGIELDQSAVAAFFTENHLAVEIHREGALLRYTSERITLYCGDFFDLTAEHLKNVHALYDRGALVALPSAMQTQYVRHLLSLLASRIPMFIVTLEYAQDEMQGPPFSVTEATLMAYYGLHYAVTKMSEEDILPTHPCFADRGLSRLQENSYVLFSK